MATKKKREAMLVQDFAPEGDAFFLGMKSLNIKSVEAAREMKANVIPVVAKHLCREIPAEACRSGGRIDPSRTALNYTLIPGMTTEAAITACAITAMQEHVIERQRERKDQIMGVELVFSLPVGFQGDQRRFFTECLKWSERHFPAPAQIVAAVVHLDEAMPHLHVVLVPIVAPGRMDGHKVVGYVGLYAKRVSSFHEEVAERFGLRKPQPKVKLTSTQRHQLADRTIAQMMADGWVASPSAVKALRRMLIADPLPVAQSVGLSAGDATPIELQPTAYAVAVDSVQSLPDGATALQCNAVPSSASSTDAELSHADPVETTLTAPAAPSSIVPSERPRPKKWVELMTAVMPKERPASKPCPILPPIIVPKKPERMAQAAPEQIQPIQSPIRTSARSQIMLGLRTAGHLRGRAW